MSWFINSIGTPAAVKAAIVTNTTLSPNLRAALLEICEDAPYTNSGHDAISIEGSGHSGEGSYVNGLKVTRFKLAAEPVAVVTPQP